MATNNNNLGELLPIKESNGQRAVNARDLYLFLGYDKSQWARWYTKNIINNEFAEEGIDYQTFDIMSNGNATKEFALSIDFAKELSMLARNDNGKKARRYFIACEQKLKATSPAFQIPQTFGDALLLAAQQQKQIEVQQKQLEEKEKQITRLEEMTAYTRMVLNSPSTVLVTQIAQDYGMSAIKFNATLRDLNIQRKVGRQWILYAKFLDKGYVQSQTQDITHADGTPDVVLTTKWTQKGRLFLYNELKKTGILPLIEQNRMFQEGGQYAN